MPDVQYGDFVFWHADIAHEVDKEHNGAGHSSVLYYAQTPLSITNIPALLETKNAFLANKSPSDYASQLSAEEKDKEYQDADKKNILNDDGLRAMGLLEFDVSKPGLTTGQRRVRELANKALKEEVFDTRPYLNDYEKKNSTV